MQWLLIFSLTSFYMKWTSVSCANCNVCSESSLACVSLTQFSVCVNDLPTETVTSCPTGYICSTTSTSICELSAGDNVIGDCSDCNTCDATRTFACTGLRTYALCLGTTTVSDLGGTCAPYHVCNIDYKYICGNSTMGIQATCPSTGETETTTTTETSTTDTTQTVATTTTQSQIVSVTNPLSYCQTLQQNGRFPAGNELTTTCKQYVYCFVNRSVWYGALYFCPGSTYFNSSSRYCTPNIPARCLGNTQRLALRSFDLNF
ncbi:uncharacterized protein [Eurosta solidaginis]|uniref:uncharacterized protein n=1 Tax=Eurosta solidaginis TaxID=178769 RepID=UPI0035316962